MGARIKDIAKIAGVSPATVSLVLNDKPGVGVETRERIREVADSLGYPGPKIVRRKPAAAGSIRFFHIARHGHAVNRDHDVFIADYIEGLGQGARQFGMNLEIVTFKAAPIETIIEAARTCTAAGIIVLGTELNGEDVEAFSGVRKPIVFLDTWHEFLPFDFVDMNNEDSVFTIVSYLQARGHTEIGIVKSTIETKNFKLREEGFRAALQRRNLRYDERFIFAVDSTFHGAYEDMKAILGRGTRFPSALFCCNDIIACGCLRALRENGIRVPGDVSIVGFDDLPLSAVSDPPLTTIQVSKEQIGRMAVQLLVTRIQSGTVQQPPVKVLISGRLIERQSVKDLASPEP